jgi:hypothetical protein
MPIQHAIWKVRATPEALTVSKLATEKDLEDRITARPEMISSDWMLIGRQVRIEHHEAMADGQRSLLRLRKIHVLVN